MGCDQSRDEIRISDFDDFGEDINKEPEKKLYNLYNKDYYYWVWNMNSKNKNDFFSQVSESWMPFPIDISRNLEVSYTSKEITYSIRTFTHKILFDFKGKIAYIFNIKKKNETLTKENDAHQNQNEEKFYSNLNHFSDNFNDDHCKKILYLNPNLIQRSKVSN